MRYVRFGRLARQLGCTLDAKRLEWSLFQGVAVLRGFDGDQSTTRAVLTGVVLPQIGKGLENFGQYSPGT